ncbi:THC0290_0291 family protein [Zunongwangia endophytica]|uniref:Glutamate dehydrogenase n=1 Tax=Zunongwangia endophytica TaxID=1808945 RepID=A0ABV8H3J8_9FLAO|nr:glutamate dehydrogenase [Zunongwangia endophytica]MDN3595801.1 glutamate dehydrogenase [Zunongwangia endophytica]
MKRIRISFLIVFLCLLSDFGYGQVLHEIGVTAGPLAITTDYGQRGEFRNFYQNTGFGIGFQHYMNFVFTGNNNQTNYFKDFFRVRTEIDYFHTYLDHYGPISYQNNPRGEMLRAMHGEAQLIEFGSQLEWHFTQIREFLIFSYRFSPYVTVGAHLAYYMPDAYSDLGPLDRPGVLFPSFTDGLNLDNGITYNLLFGGGTRYRLGRNSDLVAEIKWQYYGSDYIEGLDVQGPQNQSNDWSIWFNFGYIYYLNF